MLGDLGGGQKNEAVHKKIYEKNMAKESILDRTLRDLKPGRRELFVGYATRDYRISRVECLGENRVTLTRYFIARS